MKLEDSGLKTDLHNANLGTQRGRGLLEKSLRNLGAGRSILADKNGNIIAGNKTLEGAAEIDLPVRIVETDGKELVVVKRMDLDLYSDTDKRGRTLAYADNKIAELDLSWSPEQINADFAELDLAGWGFELEQDEEIYSRKVETPIYNITGDNPPISELYDDLRCSQLIEEIDNSDMPDDIKQFLTISAWRHIVFNFSKIAEYYAHADKDVQLLMENSALVIIDFNKAIELGYVKLTEELKKQFLIEYPDE